MDKNKELLRLTDKIAELIGQEGYDLRRGKLENGTTCVHIEVTSTGNIYLNPDGTIQADGFLAE